MENTTKKHAKLTPFAFGIPNTQTLIQGHMNPLRLPVSYVLNTMGKIDAQPLQTIAYQMQNN